MNKKTILIAGIIILMVSFVAFKVSFSDKESSSDNKTVSAVQQSLPPSENNPPKIVSTKPEPLEEAVISANEQIEITFSHPLENEGQFKIRVEPKVDFKIVLSGDRKTARIIPQIPFELGAGYTLFILPDSKFDGVGEWRKEKIFHFQTIKYRGV